MGRRQAILAPLFLGDLTFWIKHDHKVALRVIRLIDAVLRDPFMGEGKPEPLKRLDPSHWSRRITDEHRLVYEVSNDSVYFLQGRYHH